MALTMEVREEIRAPLARVMEVLTDLDGANGWMPNLVRMEKLTDGPYGVGTKWRETRKLFGKEASEVFEVTRFDPPGDLEVYCDGRLGTSGRGEYRFRYRLQPGGVGTVVTLHGVIGGMGRFMELLGKLFLGSFKKAIAKDLDAMKRYIESRH